MGSQMGWLYRTGVVVHVQFNFVQQGRESHGERIRKGVSGT